MTNSLSRGTGDPLREMWQRLNPPDYSSHHSNAPQIAAPVISSSTTSAMIRSRTTTRSRLPLEHQLSLPPMRSFADTDRVGGASDKTDHFREAHAEFRRKSTDFQRKLYTKKLKVENEFFIHKINYPKRSKITGTPESHSR